jgi:hypothetical protein
MFRDLIQCPQEEQLKAVQGTPQVHSIQGDPPHIAAVLNREAALPRVHQAAATHQAHQAHQAAAHQAAALPDHQGPQAEVHPEAAVRKDK